MNNETPSNEHGEIIAISCLRASCCKSFNSRASFSSSPTVVDTGESTSADVLALPRERLRRAASAEPGKTGMHKRETVCLHGARNATGFKQLVASEGVGSKLVGDGGAIRAQTASAAITGSHDA